MKFTLISLLSLFIGLFLGYSALKTAETIAQTLVKTEAVFDANGLRTEVSQ